MTDIPLYKRKVTEELISFDLEFFFYFYVFFFRENEFGVLKDLLLVNEGN